MTIDVLCINFTFFIDKAARSHSVRLVRGGLNHFIKLLLPLVCLGAGDFLFASIQLTRFISPSIERIDRNTQSLKQLFEKKVALAHEIGQVRHLFQAAGKQVAKLEGSLPTIVVIAAGLPFWLQASSWSSTFSKRIQSNDQKIIFRPAVRASHRHRSKNFISAGVAHHHKSSRLHTMGANKMDRDAPSWKHEGGVGNPNQQVLTLLRKLFDSDVFHSVRTVRGEVHSEQRVVHEKGAGVNFYGEALRSIYKHNQCLSSDIEAEISRVPAGNSAHTDAWGSVWACGGRVDGSVIERSDNTLKMMTVDLFYASYAVSDGLAFMAYRHESWRYAIPADGQVAADSENAKSNYAPPLRDA